LWEGLPTSLDELEAITDIALVGDEEQAAVMERLVQGSFFSGDFRPERNASTNNTMDFGVVEVGSRICLACMRSEGASFLLVGVLNVVAKVIVA
jgi:hypothetical protein